RTSKRLILNDEIHQSHKNKHLISLCWAENEIHPPVKRPQRGAKRAPTVGLMRQRESPPLRAGSFPPSGLLLFVMLQVQLNNRKHRALRIAQYREATNLRNVGWRNILTTTRRYGFLRGPITIIDSNIDAPVRRHRSHVRLNLHDPADVFFAVNDLGIRRRAAIGFRLPTKELGV